MEKFQAAAPDGRDTRTGMAEPGSPSSPSFLTSPPTVAPEPRELQRMVVPVASSPYRAAGEVSQPRTAERTPAYDPRPKPPKFEYVPPPLGDRAGEHLEMTRGKYEAWMHVVIAFVLEIAITTCIHAS